MNRLANVIIERLKKSSIANKNGNNIILFSDVDVIPDVPYVVVKPENGVNKNTRQYRIIVHMKQGMADALEDYVLKELDSILLGVIDDEDGNRYKLYADNYTDITPEPEDNSYFMERLYYTPLNIK